ncbi:hypothetical protein Ciccas_000718 [Cichlidogyrus casuarinus]|uniref:PRORP domain-containing protein n=1 Tax=Cichlidogyrus casuarinus TaxID=1844966 RepID=A0ABD2QM56_9PLAT
MLILEILNQSCNISSGWKLVEYLKKYSEEKNNPANLIEHLRLTFQTHMDACLYRGSYDDIKRCFTFFPRKIDLPRRNSIFLLSQNANFANGDPLLLDLLKRYASLGTPFHHKFPTVYQRFFPHNKFKTVLNIEPRESRCSNCGQKLPSISVSHEERDTLAREIMRKVIMDPGNIFLKDEGSFDRTLDQFINFTHSQEDKFDCIFDWPNLFYGKYIKMDNKFTGFMETIREACEVLNKELGLRSFCMVIRKKLRAQGISINSFNVPYTSIDDPFMIYLALVSHENCHLVSQDKYGTHKQIINPASQLILSKWQTARQISYFNFRPNVKFTFRKDSQWDPVLHSTNDGCFHVPYERLRTNTKSFITPEDRMNFLEKRCWLACVTKIQ